MRGVNLAHYGACTNSTGVKLLMMTMMIIMMMMMMMMVMIKIIIIITDVTQIQSAQLEVKPS